MKREILCIECRNSLIGKLGSYEGEHTTSIQGRLKVNCVCDQCVKDLPVGTLAYAFSIRQDHENWEWESQYVDFGAS